MPALVHLPADAAAAEIVAVLERDGALILDDALPLHAWTTPSSS